MPAVLAIADDEAPAMRTGMWGLWLSCPAFGCSSWVRPLLRNRADSPPCCLSLTKDPAPKPFSTHLTVDRREPLLLFSGLRP
jgi:hypothetical protein